MITLILVTFVNIFVPLFSGALLLRVIMSYVAKPGNRLMEGLVGLTEPVLAPIRKVLPSSNGIDFSPLVALLLLQLVQSVLAGFIAG